MDSGQQLVGRNGTRLDSAGAGWHQNCRVQEQRQLMRIAVGRFVEGDSRALVEVLDARRERGPLGLGSGNVLTPLEQSGFTCNIAPDYSSVV